MVKLEALPAATLETAMAIFAPKLKTAFSKGMVVIRWDAKLLEEKVVSNKFILAVTDKVAAGGGLPRTNSAAVK